VSERTLSKPRPPVRVPLRSVVELQRRQHLTWERALALARALYSHPCLGEPKSTNALVCGASAKVVRIVGRERPDLPITQHIGDYAWQPFRRGSVSSMLSIVRLSIRTSVGRSKHPWFWIVFNQLAALVPLAILGQAIGGPELAVAITAVGLLSRLPYRVIQLSGRLDGLVRAVGPEKRLSRPSLMWTIAGAAASCVEVLPALALVMSASLLAGGGPAIVGVLGGLALVSLVVVGSSSAALFLVLGQHFPEHPDTRQAIRVSGQVFIAASLLAAWLLHSSPFLRSLDMAVASVPVLSILVGLMLIGLGQVSLLFMTAAGASTLVLTGVLAWQGVKIFRQNARGTQGLLRPSDLDDDGN
jgi:hypothetical protein